MRTKEITLNQEKQLNEIHVKLCILCACHDRLAYGGKKEKTERKKEVDTSGDSNQAYQGMAELEKIEGITVCTVLARRKEICEEIVK
jgi:hypothetical protein